jgi:hypothetical protein
MVELLVAGVITAFVVGSITMSLSQLGRAKTSTRKRFDAHLRADAALTTLRRDIVSITRSFDLFDTRFVIYDETINTPRGRLDRDELVLFTTRMRPIRSNEYNGEGLEYETQYRIEMDGGGPVLWQRRDALPDEFPLGGGLVSPLVEGVLSIDFLMYDGEQWLSEWDSDLDGLPHAVRVTVSASGHQNGDDVYDSPVATLRTIVGIDRVPVPADILDAEEDIDEEIADAEQAEEEAAAAEAAGAQGGAGGAGGGTGGAGAGSIDTGGGADGVDRDTGGDTSTDRSGGGGSGTSSTIGDRR